MKNKTKGEGRGEEDRMKTERKKEEKRVGIKYLKTKGSTVLGLDPVQSNLVLGILVTSTNTGHDGSVVSALASEAKGAKGRVSIPSCGTSFFSHKYFPSSLSE